MPICSFTWSYIAGVAPGSSAIIITAIGLPPSGREFPRILRPAGPNGSRERRPPLRPRPRLLELRRHAEQRRLVRRAPDQLDTDRQAVVAPVERQRDRRLAAD